MATGSSTVYHFLHLSLQELCAAYYIASLPSPETQHIKALKKMTQSNSLKRFTAHFQPVCEFYSALTHLDNPQVVSQLVDIYNDKTRYGFDVYDDGDTLWRGHFAIKCHDTSALLQTQSASAFSMCLVEADNPNLTAEIIGTKVTIGSFIERALVLAVKQAFHLESVSCNYLPNISKALVGKLSLKHLKMRIKKFADMEHMKHVLTTCTNLEHFHMSGGNLGDALSHLAAVLNQTSIRTLHLSPTKIEEAGMIALSSALATNATIQNLTLSCRVGMGEVCMTALSSALKTNPTIQHLTISCEDGIGEASIIALSSALATNTTIQPLTITDIYTSVEGMCGIGEAGIVGQSSLLRISTTIKPGCRQYKMYRFPLKYPKVFPKVKDGCGIGEDGMVALSSVLSTNTTLRCLNVNGSNFGDKGATHLAKALDHTSLQEIDISYCDIREDGMRELSLALKTNTTLKCLYVYGNSFGDKGASHLAEALTYNTSLQEIDISYCGIGEEGMKALSSALKTNTTLMHLSICENQCEDEGIIALSSALSANTTLTHLNVSLKIKEPRPLHTSWEMSGHSQLALARAILQNTTLTSLNGNSRWHHVFTRGVTRELMKDTSTFYTSIKRSPNVKYISITRTTSLGEALWSGNMEKTAEILELNQPPAVEKTLEIHMNNDTWKVDYGAKKVFETAEGLLQIHNNPTSWNRHELTLEGMALRNAGACLLAEMLNRTQIRKLDITCCDIPEEGIVALSEALSTNTTLEYLAIGGNLINKCGQEALARALTENTTLTVLDISAHDFSLYDKSFEDSGEIFFQSLKQFSLSTIIVNDFRTSLEEVYTGWHGKVMDWETFETTLLPTHSP